MGSEHRLVGSPGELGEAKTVCLDRQGIVVRDPGEARIRKDREVVCSVGPHPFAECAQKLRVGPTADAGFRIRRDVRTVEGPEWGGERPASGQLLSASSGVA